ncbi:hypothetical protein H311_04695 [Anncaliia algerae PRA109]|nr:hypothetical protein H311_04695 [Anncaliia algerae PRA109]
MDEIIENIKKRFPDMIPTQEINSTLEELHKKGYIRQPREIYLTMPTVEFLYIIDLLRIKDAQFEEQDEFQNTFMNLRRETDSILYDKSDKDLLVTDENDLDLKAKDILLRCIKAYLKYDEPKKNNYLRSIIMALAVVFVVYISYKEEPY